MQSLELLISRNTHVAVAACSYVLSPYMPAKSTLHGKPDEPTFQ